MSDCEGIEAENRVLKGVIGIIEGMLECHENRELAMRQRMAKERQTASEAVTERVKTETESLKRQTVQATAEATRLKGDIRALNVEYDKLKAAYDQSELERHEFARAAQLRRETILKMVEHCRRDGTPGHIGDDLKQLAEEEGAL